MQPIAGASEQEADKMATIVTCHREILALYLDLRLRWVRIYGKRWDYLYGNADLLSTSTRRLQLNQNYGLCLDNPAAVPVVALEVLLEKVKEHFND